MGVAVGVRTGGGGSGVFGVGDFNFFWLVFQPERVVLAIHWLLNSNYSLEKNHDDVEIWFRVYWL